MNTLTPYYGEFLFSPLPLELSLVEPCDYSCAYCFAILNDRYWANKKGKAVHAHNTKSVMNLLADYQNRSTLEATLLKLGYPVLLSNRTDPFGRKNRSAVLPILEVLGELGIPVAFQTKGFTQEADFDEVMRLVKPSWWYISISFSNDDDRKRIEPGAPPIEHRLELIKALRQHGHEVTVGINPCVPEWVGNPEPLLQRIKDAGAWGIFAATLHLSKDQVANLSDREVAALTPDIIDRARKKNSPDRDFVAQVVEMALELGLESGGEGISTYTRFWDSCHRCYDKAFPTNQDFFNSCWENLEDGDLVGYQDYAEAMLPHLPEGKLSVGHYIGSTSRSITKENKGNWTNYFTYDELLQWFWREPRLGLSPVNGGCLSYVAGKDNGEYVQLIDEAQRPLMVFRRSGFDAYYVDAETLQPIVNGNS